MSTYNRVRFRLASALPVGYSLSGKVVAAANDVTDYAADDLVACAGAGYANHSEIVFIPRNLCARVPTQMPLEHAALGTIGAIAVHAFRQAELAVGETVAILGLGLVGLLVVVVARAAGCRVIGIDPVQNKRNLAIDIGADRAVDRQLSQTAIQEISAGIGADAVIICASTSSSDPLETAARLARDRARVVVVGSVGMEVPRQAYYEKELTLKLSRSYGPGRYDPAYEAKGYDYPVGYVRWTEKRNLESFLEIASKAPIAIDRLISHRFPLDRGAEAYEVLRTNPDVVGILLEYQRERSLISRRLDVPARRPRRTNGSVRVGLIGAGNFAQGVLLPVLARRSDVRLHAVATASGLSARSVADRYGSQYATSDYIEILQDPEVDCVMICTRHDTHARILIDALRHGKIAFVEKPLAITHDQLRGIEDAAAESSATFMVGFNRRYSPMIRALRDFLSYDTAGLMMHYRVNAGSLSRDHWLNDEDQGGRMLGEVCHFVDTLQFLAHSAPVQVFGQATHTPGSPDVTVLLRFVSGAVGSITYTISGDISPGKERLEVFGGGRFGVIDDFKDCSLHEGGRARRLRSLGRTKGHPEELAAFIEFVRGGVPRTSPDESVLTTRATLAIQESLRRGQPISI